MLSQDKAATREKRIDQYVHYCFKRSSLIVSDADRNCIDLFIYYVYEEDYTMFALSPLVGWVFFVVGIIWTIGFLKAILKTIRIQAQMNQLRKRACVCSRSILDCKNQWKEEVGVRRNVEIKTVYGLAVPIICGFLKPMILLPEREYNKEELKIICIHELIHCKQKKIFYNNL